MKCLTKKMRSPLKYHGGKSYLARKIIALFPEHREYVEPYVGGGSILLNKEPVELETVNDLNGDLINFWRELRVNKAFRCAVSHPYSEETFENAGRWSEGTNTLDHAISFMIRNRMSRGGLGRDFAWSDRLRGGQPGDVNAWKTILRELPAVIERIKNVAFVNIDATKLIRGHDGEGVLFYLDPPYLHETRSVKKAYAHEMTRDDHEQLLELLQGVKGKVLISGYRSELYDERLAGWKRHEFSIANHSGQGATKQRRIECVWENHV